MTNGKHDGQPRWSPDGKWIAFVRGGDKDETGKPKPPQIAMLSLAGGEAWIITDLPKGAANPIWSPDSRRLAFSEFHHARRHREGAAQEECRQTRRQRIGSDQEHRVAQTHRARERPRVRRSRHQPRRLSRQRRGLSRSQASRAHLGAGCAIQFRRTHQTFATHQRRLRRRRALLDPRRLAHLLPHQPHRRTVLRVPDHRHRFHFVQRRHSRKARYRLDGHRRSYDEPRWPARSLSTDRLRSRCAPTRSRICG